MPGEFPMQPAAAAAAAVDTRPSLTRTRSVAAAGVASPLDI